MVDWVARPRVVVPEEQMMCGRYLNSMIESIKVLIASVMSLILFSACHGAGINDRGIYYELEQLIISAHVFDGKKIVYDEVSCIELQSVKQNIAEKVNTKKYVASDHINTFLTKVYLSSDLILLESSCTTERNLRESELMDSWLVNCSKVAGKNGLNWIYFGENEKLDNKNIDPHYVKWCVSKRQDNEMTILEIIEG